MGLTVADRDCGKPNTTTADREKLHDTISAGTSRTILGLGCHAPNSSAGFGLATLLLPNPGVVAAPWKEN